MPVRIQASVILHEHCQMYRRDNVTLRRITTFVATPIGLVGAYFVSQKVFKTTVVVAVVVDVLYTNNALTWTEEEHRIIAQY